MRDHFDQNGGFPKETNMEVTASTTFIVEGSKMTN
jgi:hypothetical protein